MKVVGQVTRPIRIAFDNMDTEPEVKLLLKVMSFF